MPASKFQVKPAAEFSTSTAADAWSYASYLCEDQGDLRAAAGALDKALKLSPNDPELLARQGLMLLRLGDYESAIKVLRHRVKRRKTRKGTPTQARQNLSCAP